MRRLKHWGWGYEDQQRPHAELVAAAEGIVPMLGFGLEPERPVPLEQVDAHALVGGLVFSGIAVETAQRAFLLHPAAAVGQAGDHP